MTDVSVYEDDGLITPEIGSWGENKYRLVSHYASLFAKSMRTKWECLVYLDLFSGAGKSRIRGTNRIMAASPLLVLDLPDKFNIYIFCEKDVEKCSALDKRIKKDFSHVAHHIINGDANTEIEKIIDHIPSYSKDYRVLTFCFADPCAMSNLNFDTIKQLSKLRMDFLVLIPSGMEAHRFATHYVKPSSQIVENFLGRDDWRIFWEKAEKASMPFEQFIVNEFGKSMSSIGFIDPGLNLAVPIRSDDKNLLLYRLALYSRHTLGEYFWKETKKYTDPQQDLF